MKTSGPKLARPRLVRAEEPLSAPPCPVDRLPRRRRNQLCIGVIAIGAINYLAFTLIYFALGGDAHNGYRKFVEHPDGKKQAVYVLGGHYLGNRFGQEVTVSRGTWIYSYIHSISVLLTSGAMIVSMLVLARPHIIATMRNSYFSGQTFVAAFGTMVLLATSCAVFFFTWDFVAKLR